MKFTLLCATPCAKRNDRFEKQKKNPPIVFFYFYCSHHILHYLSVSVLSFSLSLTRRKLANGVLSTGTSVNAYRYRRSEKGFKGGELEEERNEIRFSSRVKSRCSIRCLRAGFSQLVISAQRGVASPDTMVILSHRI